MICHESRHPGDEPASLCTSLHALSELPKGVGVTVPSMISSASDDVSCMPWNLEILRPEDIVVAARAPSHSLLRKVYSARFCYRRLSAHRLRRTQITSLTESQTCVCVSRCSKSRIDVAVRGLEERWTAGGKENQTSRQVQIQVETKTYGAENICICALVVIEISTNLERAGFESYSDSEPLQTSIDVPAHRPWGLQGLYTTVPSCCLTKPSLSVNTFPMVFGLSQHQSRQEAVPAWSLTVSVNDYFHASGHEVVIEPADDPQQLPQVRRWLAVLCLSTAALGITCASSMVRLA